MEQNHDVIIVDLDSNPEYALDLGGEYLRPRHGHRDGLFGGSQSRSDDPLHEGPEAREFLTQPFTSDDLEEALVRASVRRPWRTTCEEDGRTAAGFFGAKGGAGVTILASNFAIMLARECSQSVLLIDLDLPLGDAALTLGVAGQYSTVDALQNASRLDSNFLSKLLRKYSPELSVLAAPGKFTRTEVSQEAINRLVTVARQDFDYVVVDSGSRLDLIGTTLFEEAATVYLVTQVGIPELRNSNRLVSEFFTRELSKLEIVINRYEPSLLGVDEEHITKAPHHAGQMEDSQRSRHRDQDTEYGFPAGSE